MRRLVLIHAAGNAVLLGVAYYWLGIGESRALSLVWSLLVALFLMALATATYGAALVYFRSADNPWRTTLKNLLPLLVAGLAVLAIYFLLARWSEYSVNPANKIASYFTLKLRKPVRPATVLAVFRVALWLVRWVVLPVLLLPMAAAIAERAWRGFKAFGAMRRRWIYWAEVPLLLLCAFWLPLKLLGWIPPINGFGLEMASFVVRAAMAYLLLVAGWLALAFVTAGGREQLAADAGRTEVVP